MNIKPMTHVLGCVMISCALGAVSAQAYTINNNATDVGGLDIFQGTTTQQILGDSNGNGNGNSSADPATEEAWAEGILGIDLLYEDVKTEDVSIQLVDGSTSIIAFSLLSDPGYYVVKDSTTFVLFENIDAFG